MKTHKFRKSLIVFYLCIQSSVAIGVDEIKQHLTQLDDLGKASVLSEFCENEKNYKPFERISPQEFQIEYMGSNPGEHDLWEENFLVDKKTKEQHFLGLSLDNYGINSIAGKPINSELETSREWKFFSKDKSKRDTFLWITDDPGSGKLSDRMDSMIVLIPRKTLPFIKIENDDLVVTLPTGEKVFYDKKTKKIKKGVLKETKIDTNPSANSRKFAGVDYQGSGISIRIDHRGEDPRIFSKIAVIKQNDKICKLPTKDLWDGAQFKFPEDGDLKNFLDLKCNQKFNLI